MDHTTLLVQLNLKLRCQGQVYAIIVTGAYILVKL